MVEEIIKKITTDLPNIPMDAVDTWLGPFAKSDGWPPSNGRWSLLLPKTTSLDFWKKTKWKEAEVDFFSIPLSETELKKLNDMYDAYINEKENDYSSMRRDGGGKRYARSLKHLLQTGNLPLRPILFKEKEGTFQIVDGNHRILALRRAMAISKNPEATKKICEAFRLSEICPPKQNQPVWICEPEWGAVF